MNLLVFLSVFLPLSSSYKVLVYNPRFAFAHVQYMGNLADILVDDGFDVTVLLNDVDDRYPHNGTSKAKRIFVPACEEAAKNIRKATDDEFCKEIWKTSATNPLIMTSLKDVFKEVSVPQCRFLLAQKNILQQLKEEKFDVGVTEVFESCGLGLFEALGIKSVVIGSSMSILEATSASVGAPLFPSFTPGSFAQGTDSMSFWDRLENIIHMAISYDFSASLGDAQHKLFVKKYGNNFPSMEVRLEFFKEPVFQTLVSKAQLVFTNSVPYFDYPRLTLRKVLDLGGITYQKPKPLSEEWEGILKNKKVVLLSFGSVAKSIHMPEVYKANLIEAIKQFSNVTFIWKHEHPIDPRLMEVENVVASTWVPQRDLLAHPNVVGFITHGGANSVTEAAFAGKPMIVVPIFADQTRMGNIAQSRGIGILLSKDQLADIDVLAGAVHKMLYSDEIKQACERLLMLLSSVDYNPVKVFTDHVKLLAQFKSLKELQPKSAELSTFVLYGLDIALFLLLAALVLVLLVFLVFKQLYTLFSSFYCSLKKKVE